MSGSPRPIPAVFSILLIILGLVTGAGGIWLLTLGGSVYYLIAGAALIATGALIWRRNPLALWLYAAILLGSILWALWEVGFDWWQLAPRGDLLVILGLLFALPWVARGVQPLGENRQAMFRSGWGALGASLVVSAAVALIALVTPNAHELHGNLPERPAMTGGALSAADAGGEWRAYGGSAAGRRYSTLDQITPANVKDLEVAWTYNTGDPRRAGDPNETTYEVTPLKVGDTLYLCTPRSVVIALDAETGAEKWRFDPALRQPPTETTQHLTCRGVSYHDAQATRPDGEPVPAMTPDSTSPSLTPLVAAPDCVRRVFLPTSDGRLIAISAATGKVCPGFGGEDGTVDLWANMPNVTPGAYYSTSPPVVTDRLIVVGGAVNDNVSTTEPSGVIRAFDIDTGALVWNWDSRNPDETAPIASDAKYMESSPNSWSVSSYDADLGLIYIPMGNQPPDQYGGHRDANTEKYAAAIVALRADSGQVAWVFQTVHHDLWDMDVPAQPSLIDLTIDGAIVPALVAPTKQGEIFVLDRRTGEPVLPVTETPAPQGAVEGDRTAPTQPVSALSFNPPKLTEASMWGATMLDQLACRIAFKTMRYEGRYTPPSLQGTIVYPGNFGTFNWGGVAVDPERQAVFAMPVYIAFTSKMLPRGNPEDRLVSKPGDPAFNENFGAPYAVEMGPFLSPVGLPCQPPPWGYVAGADLTTGKIAYKHINGTVRDLSPIPLPLTMGVPGLGGPVVTKGGVAFLSGTLDYYVRGYDVTTGRKLWESRLPAGGQATPMTYWSNASKRQFLLVVAGGHGSSGTKAGDSVIAYALPQ